MELGKLEKVKLRNIWKHEALDFTSWLSKEENIQILSEELNSISISVIDTEHKVGSFSVDILAEEEESGKKIIIENQLEKTDHDHLGKLITYASGMDAKYIIWITSEARDEHRSAVEWLNKVTNDDLYFFLVRIEAWKIGDSKVAPKFMIIEEPNAWSKAVKIQRTSDDLTGARLNRIEFWNVLNDAIDKYSNVFNTKKASTDHWFNLPINTSKAHISINLMQKEKNIRIEILIPNDKKLYHKLHSVKESFEKDLGYSLEWNEGEGIKRATIYTIISNFDVNDKDSWASVAKQIVITSEKIRKVFIKYNK